MSPPGYGIGTQTPSRRRPAATAASSLERNGSGANTETRSTPLKWPSRILPTEPSARATARSTLHSSANDERRLLPSWGSGAAIASTPDAARSLKGLSGKAGRASRSAAPEAIRERTDSRPVAVRARLAVPINAPVLSGSLAIIRSRARHRDRRPGTVRTRESARVTSCSIRATVSPQPERLAPGPSPSCMRITAPGRRSACTGEHLRCVSPRQSGVDAPGDELESQVLATACVCGVRTPMADAIVFGRTPRA